MNIVTFIFIIISYLLGSISSAILISQHKKLPDPRSYGSKNPGATNILRKIGVKTAIIVIIFDILKGMIPILISTIYLKLTPLEIESIALAVYLGHVYPIFFNFHGGKGVATAFGCLTIIGLDISGIMLATWVLSILIFGYSSLGSIIASCVTPIYILWMHPKFTPLAIILSLLILIKHHSNIIRLYHKKEKKVWNNKKI